TIESRKEKEKELQKVRDDITKKGDILSKLEASLPYRTVEGLDRALKNLEYQLQHKKLTSREENRLVREIETLKRSWSLVREYDRKKKDIKADKDSKSKLQDEKDKYFNHVSDLKKQEEVIKQRLSTVKRKEDEAWARYREGGERRDQLKTEIDLLYENKRQAYTIHKQDQEKYKKHMKEYREGEKKRTEEARKARHAERIKLQREYDESREPYLEERQTCAALIKYLQSYIPQEDEANLNTAAKVRHSTESLYQKDHLEGEFTVLRRKGDSDDEGGVSQLSGRRKKGRRQRRHSGHSKSLRHSHQVFSQFLSMKMDAPPTMAEVVETLVKLRSKLDYLEKLAKDEKLQSEVGSSHGSDFTMSSDYSTGTNELSQDHQLIEDDELIPEGGDEEVDDSRFLQSDASKDDGIHSLSSSSTVNDLESNHDTPFVSLDPSEEPNDDTQKSGYPGSRQDEGLADIKDSRSGQNEINDQKSVTEEDLVENTINSEKLNGFKEGEIIAKVRESGEFLSSDVKHIHESMENCSLVDGTPSIEVDGPLLNGGECNSNNSNARSNGSSKTQTVEYLRTLSDTINQNDVVVVKPELITDFRSRF
ncbi:hypothetical protein BSL78_29395, partial [Apostichopus japonicus]